MHADNAGRRLCFSLSVPASKKNRIGKKRKAKAGISSSEGGCCPLMVSKAKSGEGSRWAAGGSPRSPAKGLLQGTGAEPSCLTAQAAQEKITLRVRDYCRESCFGGLRFPCFSVLFPLRELVFLAKIAEFEW